jgi:hypothetical protein
MRFANADSDDKLVAFVRRFGPVVAKSVSHIRPIFRIELVAPEKRLDPPPPFGTLTAQQDMQELRNEHSIYHAALRLVILLKERDFEYDSARTFIRQISAHIGDWPRQWERERSQRQSEPIWKPMTESLRRIEDLASAGRDALLPSTLDSRIVICELLNSFRGAVFPNPIEMHGSIRYGIRPLLYSILKRQFLAPRDFAVCANTQCRDFFNVERGGQQFCSEDCSRRQRQRLYWKKRGKKLRKVRSKRQRKTRSADGG